MEKWPKLRIWSQLSGQTSLEDFERARNLPYAGGQIVAVEGHLVTSYQGLLNLIEEEHLGAREYLDVKLMPIFYGG